MAAHGRRFLATLHLGPVVLDAHRLVVGCLRALGMDALSLRLVVSLASRGLGLVVGSLLVSRQRRLALVVGPRGMVSARLLQPLLVESVVLGRL